MEHEEIILNEMVEMLTQHFKDNKNTLEAAKKFSQKIDDLMIEAAVIVRKNEFNK